MNVNNKIGVKSRNHIRSKQVLFKMTPCCLAISAIFAQQAYAETVTQTAEVSENATQKPVTQLQKIVVTATRTPKILQRLQVQFNLLIRNKLSSKLRRVVKLLIFLLNLYHLLHQVVEQQVIMVRQCVDETY